MSQKTAILLDHVRTFRKPRVAPTDRVYAIGDIHGRFDLLLELMQKITEDAARFDDERQVKIVFLGDYIDRGEDSRQVLEVLARMADFETPNIVFLRGNHEDALRYFLYSPSEGAEWFEFGGLQTLGSFGIRPPQPRLGKRDLFRVRSELSEAIGSFENLFDSMVNSYRSGDVVFIHAGVDPSKSIDAQSPRTLIWGHVHAQAADPIPGLRLVHGHYDGDTPVSEPGRICVDTGAYYTGRLTAVRLDESEAFLSTG